jgi:hypothetical protein
MEWQERERTGAWNGSNIRNGNVQEHGMAVILGMGTYRSMEWQ